MWPLHPVVKPITAGLRMLQRLLDELLRLRLRLAAPRQALEARYSEPQTRSR